MKTSWAWAYTMLLSALFTTSLITASVLEMQVQLSSPAGIVLHCSVTLYLVLAIAHMGCVLFAHFKEAMSLLGESDFRCKLTVYFVIPAMVVMGVLSCITYLNDATAQTYQYAIFLIPLLIGTVLLSLLLILTMDIVLPQSSALFLPLTPQRIVWMLHTSVIGMTMLVSIVNELATGCDESNNKLQKRIFQTVYTFIFFKLLVTTAELASSKIRRPQLFIIKTLRSPCRPANRSVEMEIAKLRDPLLF
eukprot:ANDGO_06976.mRNA.1 hypothetical protein